MFHILSIICSYKKAETNYLFIYPFLWEESQPNFCMSLSKTSFKFINQQPKPTAGNEIPNSVLIKVTEHLEERRNIAIKKHED